MFMVLTVLISLETQFIAIGMLHKGLYYTFFPVHVKEEKKNDANVPTTLENSVYDQNIKFIPIRSNTFGIVDERRRFAYHSPSDIISACLSPWLF